MKTCFLICLVVLLPATVAGTAATAFAQDSGLPPPGGLFGGRRVASNAPETLDFTMSLVEGYDSDVPGELRFALDPGALQSGGLWSMLNANAEYARDRSSVQVGASASAALRYYPSLDRFRNIAESVGIGIFVRLPRRTTLSANQSAAYSPAYLYALFPSGTATELGAAPAAAPNYEVGGTQSYQYNTRVALTHNLTRRQSLLAEGEFAYSDFAHDTTDRPDLKTQAIRGSYSRNLARNTKLTTAYRYRATAFGVPDEMIEHGADVGVEYERRLSSARRATLGFKAGPSTLDIPDSVGGGVVPGRHYHLFGEATFGFAFATRWRMAANVGRTLQYVAELSQPVFVDGATVGLEGLMFRRWDLSAFAGYSNGESAVARQNLVFKSYTSSVRVRYALASAMAFYVEYLNYFYDFGQSPGVPGIPSRLTRNGVRTGLTLRVSALSR